MIVHYINVTRMMNTFILFIYFYNSTSVGLRGSLVVQLAVHTSGANEFHDALYIKIFPTILPRSITRYLPQTLWMMYTMCTTTYEPTPRIQALNEYRPPTSSTIFPDVRVIRRGRRRHHIVTGVRARARVCTVPGRKASGIKKLFFSRGCATVAPWRCAYTCYY